jgi:ATP-dependent Zn protease
MNSIARIKVAIACAVVVLAGIAVWMVGGSHAEQATISYSQFIQQVRAGRVARVEVASGNLGASPATIHLKDGQISRTILPLDYSAALALLEDQLVNVEIQDASSSPMRLLVNATPFLLLLAVWFFLLFNRRRFLRWRD